MDSRRLYHFLTTQDVIYELQIKAESRSGTLFQYRKMRKGNENENPCAEKQPVQFAGVEYIRVGTNKKNLKEYPDKERELWQAFDTTPYELRLAKSNATEDELAFLLDYPKYYDKMGMPIPRNRDKVLDDLQNKKFIIKNDAGIWNITNMGASKYNRCRVD